MNADVQIFDLNGDYATSGVAVESARWLDGGAGTPSASVAAVNSGTYGEWRVTVLDPTPPRGPATIRITYDDGDGGTARSIVTVNDLRLAEASITDAALAEDSMLEWTAARLGGGNATRNTATGEKTFRRRDGSKAFDETAESVVGTTGTVTRS